jgi:hypothetical protein
MLTRWLAAGASEPGLDLVERHPKPPRVRPLRIARPAGAIRLDPIEPEADRLGIAAPRTFEPELAPLAGPAQAIFPRLVDSRHTRSVLEAMPGVTTFVACPAPAPFAGHDTGPPR